MENAVLLVTALTALSGLLVSMRVSRKYKLQASQLRQENAKLNSVLKTITEIATEEALKGQNE